MSFLQPNIGETIQSKASVTVKVLLYLSDFPGVQWGEGGEGDIACFQNIWHTLLPRKSSNNVQTGCLYFIRINHHSVTVIQDAIDYASFLFNCEACHSFNGVMGQLRVLSSQISVDLPIEVLKYFLLRHSCFKTDSNPLKDLGAPLQGIKPI